MENIVRLFHVLRFYNLNFTYRAKDSRQLCLEGLESLILNIYMLRTQGGVRQVRAKIV